MKTYGLRCPIARTLDLIGERWTLLMLRDLFVHGERRFQDFQSSLEGISPTTLTQRLRQLEEAKIVARRAHAESPPRVTYSLTPKGRELGPIIRSLREWGSRHAQRP